MSDRFSRQLEGFVGVVGFLASRNEPAGHSVKSSRSNRVSRTRVPYRLPSLAPASIVVLPYCQRDGFPDSGGVALVRGEVGEHVDVATEQRLKLWHQSGLVRTGPLSGSKVTSRSTSLSRMSSPLAIEPNTRTLPA